MSSLLVKVRTKLSIAVHRKVQHLLEGEYRSIFKGRSLDFDDLRPYVPGDDIRDIDWRATARSGHTLVRRYVATRKHDILVVADVGRSMAAMSSDGDSKRDLSVLASGIMGYLAQKHGDLVGLIAGNEDGVSYLPMRGSSAHLEIVLRKIHDSITEDAPQSNLLKALEYVATHIKRRTMIVIVGSVVSMDQQYEKILRLLRVQHEIMVVWIEDFAPGDPARIADSVVDVDRVMALPRFIRGNQTIHEEYRDAHTNRLSHIDRTLRRLNIVDVHLGNEKDTVPNLIKLLEKQKHGRR